MATLESRSSRFLLSWPLGGPSAACELHSKHRRLHKKPRTELQATQTSRRNANSRLKKCRQQMRRDQPRRLGSTGTSIQTMKMLHQKIVVVASSWRSSCFTAQRLTRNYGQVKRFQGASCEMQRDSDSRSLGNLLAGYLAARSQLAADLNVQLAT